MDVENRSSFVANLGKFISDCDDKLTECLEKLDWNRDQVKKKNEESFVSCPLNPNHRMPAKSLEKHLKDCTWISEGYTLEEKESSIPSSKFFYTDATTVHQVIIDKPLLNHIVKSSQRQLVQVSKQLERDVPRTANRAVTDFSVEERWAIYDYVVGQGRAADKLQNIKLEDLQLSFEKREEPHSQKSMLEILADQRDYRRRRQSYRAKNVHITKKSYTEVMKEVIENHMQILLEMRGEAGVSTVTTPETTPAPSRECSRAREDVRDRKPPSPVYPSATTCTPSRDVKRDSRERSGGTREERNRRGSHSDNRKRERRDRSHDDESRHRHKRHHSYSSKESDGKLSKTQKTSDKEENSPQRRHHHKKKSHKRHH